MMVPMAKTSNQQGKRPTIDDVAKLAGVGTMTVSRTINGHPYVSDAVAKKVHAAIRKLNYSPNRAAQMLNGRPSATIGLVVPDLADPFFAVLTHAVQQAARQHKYQVWIAASDSDIAVEKMEVDQMISRSVDGVLLVSSKADDAYLSSVTAGKVPFVAIDRPIAAVATDSLEVENYGGTREAVEHLIAHGRKRILCIGYNAQQPTIQKRVEGYVAAVRGAGLPVITEVAASETTSLRSVLAKAFSKSSPPDAIFALNNVATLHTLEALHELKVRVPNQVALIGFDDIEAWRVTNPPLTAVRQPVAEMGSLAVQILLDRTRFAGKSATRTILPTRLVLRASCGCSPS
jgi:LacI family transcriptional regulator